MITRKYGMVSMPSHIKQSMDDAAAAGFIIFGFGFLVILCPMMLLLGILVLWLVPMRSKRAKSLYAVLAFVGSYQGLEV